MSESVTITGCWLRSMDSRLEVLLEIDGKWRRVIMESVTDVGGVISHIVEPGGMREGSIALIDNAVPHRHEGWEGPAEACPVCRAHDALRRTERRELEAAAEADKLRAALSALVDACALSGGTLASNAELRARALLSEKHCPNYTQFAKNYERMEAALWNIGEATLTPGNWVPTEQAALNGMVSAARERGDMVEFHACADDAGGYARTLARLRNEGCRFFYLRPRRGDYDPRVIEVDSIQP